jgi:uncharacterized membrane protein
MTVKDVFGLIIRTVGFVPIVYGLIDAVALVLSLLHLSTRPEIAPASIAIAMVGYILIGSVIIILAKPITRLAYGRDG